MPVKMPSVMESELLHTNSGTILVPCSCMSVLAFARVAKPQVHKENENSVLTLTTFNLTYLFIEISFNVTRPS